MTTVGSLRQAPEEVESMQAQVAELESAYVDLHEVASPPPSAPPGCLEASRIAGVWSYIWELLDVGVLIRGIFFAPY